jgi:hypothetical protein
MARLLEAASSGSPAPGCFDGAFDDLDAASTTLLSLTQAQLYAAYTTALP